MNIFNIPHCHCVISYCIVKSKQNECPEPEPGCDFEAVEEAKELWKTLKVSPQAPQVFTIQMEQIAPFGKEMSKNKKFRYKRSLACHSHAQLSIDYQSVNIRQTTSATSTTFTDKMSFFLAPNVLCFVTGIFWFREILKPV